MNNIIILFICGDLNVTVFIYLPQFLTQFYPLTICRLITVLTLYILLSCVYNPITTTSNE